ncbi:hypothetical protein ACK366_02850, partial [Aeromonas veronii]
MNSIINDLLSKGKEGLWWDFKQKFHNNMAAMVHDILCMANVIHNGNRYIANSTSKCDTRLCRLTVLFEYLDRLP